MAAGRSVVELNRAGGNRVVSLLILNDQVDRLGYSPTIIHDDVGLGTIDVNSGLSWAMPARFG